MDEERSTLSDQEIATMEPGDAYRSEVMDADEDDADLDTEDADSDAADSDSNADDADADTVDPS